MQQPTPTLPTLPKRSKILCNLFLPPLTYWRIKRLPATNSQIIRNALELYLPIAEAEAKEYFNSITNPTQQ